MRWWPLCPHGLPCLPHPPDSWIILHRSHYAWSRECGSSRIHLGRIMSTLIWLAPNECDAKLKDARRHCHKSNELSSIYYVLNTIRFLLQSSLNINPASGYRAITGRGYYCWLLASTIQLGLRQKHWMENLSLSVGRSREFKASCQASRPWASIFPVGERIQSNVPS